ncbi:MAG: Ig-like domain-containing protein, partial [Verrucomicrobiota bacterium]
SFTFLVHDGGVSSAMATVTIQVDPRNDVPVAVPLTLETDQATPAAVVLGGTDAEGETLTYIVVTTPAHGTLSGTAPNLIYTPLAGYYSEPGVPDLFTYKVRDGVAESAAVQVTVNVRRVNQAPVASAGADQTVTLPAFATLTGTMQDDGLPAGITLSATWSMVSGPGALRFNDAGSAVTEAAFMAPGNYVLRFTATDSEKSAVDEVTVTVLAGNKAPIVGAGPAQQITQPSPATLAGTVTDDGLPNGSILSLSWSKVSGPGNVIFSQPNNALTQASFSAPGEYELRLIGSDGVLAGRAQVRINVSVANIAPQVHAGPARQGSMGETVSLSGSISDDGLPVTGALTALWTKLSGPGNVAFGDPNVAATNARFDAPGLYELQLYASDSSLSATDRTTVTVAAPANQAPVVSAGPDQAITGFNVANLSGKVEDDGLPNGAALTTTWTKVSGPGTVTFGDAHLAVTSVQFSEAGTYVLGLGATDSVLGATDQVTIITAFQNRPPTVDAGEDQQTPGGESVSLAGKAIDDGLPAGAPIAFHWSKVRGAGNVTFGNPNVPATTAQFSAPGSYVLRLSANDSLEEGEDEITVDVFDQCTPTPPNLVAFWKAEQNGEDMVGTNHAVLSSGARYGTGKVGDAFLLSGVSRISIPASPALNVSSGNGFTVECWIKPHSLALQPIIEWRGAGYGPHLWLSGYGAGSLSVNLVDTAGGYHVVYTAPGVIDSYKFQHVALTFEKPTGRARIWKNGQIVGEAILGSFNPQTAVDLHFGYRPGYHFSGLIDDVSLYSRALDGTELTKIYLAGSDGKCADGDQTASGIDAGPDQTTFLPYAAQLKGELLEWKGPLNHLWEVVFGPGTGQISDPHSLSTSATFSAPGTYILRLSGGESHGLHDEILITVLPLSGSNQPPQIDSIPQRFITESPWTTQLAAVVRDDGLPTPGGLAVSWSTLSGPGAVSFENAGQAATTATFSNPGQYTLRVTATDSEFTVSQDATINVGTASITGPGGVFVTGHDPDFHAVAIGENMLGAQHLLQRSIAYVSFDRVNPRILLVTGVTSPGAGFSDPRRGMVGSGFIDFDVADFGSGSSGILDLHTVNWSNYDVIVVASDYGGWLTQAELDVLNQRADTLLDFINGGGGMVVLSESDHHLSHGQLGFLPFLVTGESLGQHEASITLTAAGEAMGLVGTDINGN